MNRHDHDHGHDRDLAAAALIDGADAYGIHWCRRHPHGITQGACA